MAIWNRIGSRAVQAGANGIKTVRSLPGRIRPGANTKAAASKSASGTEQATKSTKKRGRPRYIYEEPSEAELLNQQAVWMRLEKGEKPGEALGITTMVLKTHHVPKISVIISVYEPILRYFEKTLISVLSQTYGGYELIVADMSLSSSVRELIHFYRDNRIRYYSAPGSSGESALRNDAAKIAEGDYITFVEAGDLLTKDALFQMALRIFQTGAEILYSDEDRADLSGKRFEAPYYKPDYNRDYMLSCNYMKHLLLIRRELFMALRFREAYEGAMEYDFILRAPKSGITHIPKVLYHVTKASSDARAAGSLPGSSIAAGKSALEDYMRSRGIGAQISYSERRGIYRVDYKPGIFSCRSDVGILGGRVLSRNHKVIGGLMDSSGQFIYEGYDEAEGGPYNIALTRQDAYAVDIRCMRVRPDLRKLYEEMIGEPYKESAMAGGDIEEIRRKSLLFCGAVRDLGYLIVWDPIYISIC